MVLPPREGPVNNLIEGFAWERSSCTISNRFREGIPKGGKAMGKKAMMIALLVGAIALWAGYDTAFCQGKGKKAVPVEKLTPFLKEIEGWKAEGAPEGESIKVGEGTYTVAYRSYSKGQKSLEITLIDGAGIPQAYEDYEDLKTEVGGKGPNAPKSVTVAGFPGIEVFEPESETATLMIMVKDRFLVILDVDGATAKEDLKPLALQLDLKGLAVLGGN